MPERCSDIPCVGDIRLPWISCDSHTEAYLKLTSSPYKGDLRLFLLQIDICFVRIEQHARGGSVQWMRRKMATLARKPLRRPMPTVHVTRKVHFNAAHRLHNPDKSVEWNRETFGKCNNPNWHGHNYELEVTVAGEPDPETGFVVDLADLKEILHTRILEKVDHQNLNQDVDFMEGVIPSTENFAIAIWNQLEGALPSGELECVRLYETPRNFVEYRGE